MFFGCAKNKPNKEKSFDLDFYKNHQVLLTNEAHFNGHTSLNGASAFLIDYKDSIYAVTVKHLLGEYGGVDPEIQTNDLPNAINLWKMYPRVENEVSIDTVYIKKVKFNSVNTEADILLLKTNDYHGNLHKLRPSFDMPKENDSMIVIGCQYSNTDCRQNIYPCKFQYYYEKHKMLIFKMKKKIELPGFSGAPVVNKDGLVVAVLAVGWEENGSYYVGATHIKEIENLEF